MNLRLVLLAFVTLGTFIAGANLAWQHVQHQESLPDARARSHDLRNLRLRHLGSAKVRQLGLGDGSGPADAGLWQQEGLASKAPVAERGYDAGDPRRQTYHVVVSSDGSVYNQWQSRVCYWHIQKLKAAEPHSAMGGFTRLLHSGQADGLMDEMPTVVVQPLPPGTDQGYRVLHRPWAFVQWLPYAAKLPEDYVLMAEPDHIFLHIPPLWATLDRPAAYPFSYMDPPKYVDVIDGYNVRNVSISRFAPIGNSPVQVHRDQLAELVPLWHELALKFHKDAAASKAFGWIQEASPCGAKPVSERQSQDVDQDQIASASACKMAAVAVVGCKPCDYPAVLCSSSTSAQQLARVIETEKAMYAWSVASAQLRSGPLDYQLKEALMLQPPFDMGLDRNGDKAFILHYTYGQDLSEAGAFTPGTRGFWHWDKREYEQAYPPRNISPPVKCQGAAIPTLITAINDASAAIEPWSYQPGSGL